MVHMVDHLNQTVISKCCGHCAFEKESLAVEEEVKRLFFSVLSCHRNCSVVRGRGEDILIKS